MSQRSRTAPRRKVKKMKRAVKRTKGLRPKAKERRVRLMNPKPRRTQNPLVIIIAYNWTVELDGLIISY